jgi:hypothetical protein
MHLGIQGMRFVSFFLKNPTRKPHPCVIIHKRIKENLEYHKEPQLLNESCRNKIWHLPFPITCQACLCFFIKHGGNQTE